MIKETSFGKPDTIEYLPNGQAIDFVYQNAIFSGGISPEVYPTYQENWNMITRLDKDLNIIWTKFYGGDALYELYTLTATKDSGVIITGTKFIKNSNNYDAFIIKLDSEGNTSLNTGIENPDNFVKDVILYPNPTTGIIKVHKGEQIKNAQIQIFDTKGNLITQKPLHKNITTIDLTNCQSGIYFYTIITNSQIVDKGKIILNKN